ncbi:helix-turn-helix domain-containing protein [Pseudobdellovibrio exovorus]|uniref:HTH cro/C1-type domain-containing protein n=1 Tax=Pseudobdellovibrio exovorus JSS TaxID=1184267 RepID=M4VTJ1_9BACT|nr:helix-turn-helix transcriptional regulator [Pseudobdellovibrio exovorus]AGH96499.1 hypothetical protein A11Q_2283 [Pseudobdellovibrio exovorus JSS]
MSGAAKIRLIEISIKDGAKKKFFLVPEDKAAAIATLLKDIPRNEDDAVPAKNIFPDLDDVEKRPFITFRGIRAKTGLTQQELAGRLGISQTDVSKIENGKRNIGKALAKKIEKEFKIDYRRFL